jgi:hypothetical protein
MSDSQTEMGAAKPKGMGRIERDHRVAMEKWLGTQRTYTGGKSGAKMLNIRWMMGGGAKGLDKGMRESKEVKSSGAQLALAKHINSKFNLKDDKKWTGNMAKSRFENMMKGFRKVVKEVQFPCQEEFGNDKNAYASAVQKCGEERAKKCASYNALWALLRDHPKFSQKSKQQSEAPNSDDDFESMSSNGSSDEDKDVTYAFGADGRERESEQGTDDNAEADNAEADDDDGSSGSSGSHRASPRASVTSPRASPKVRGKNAKSSPSPKPGKRRARRGEKRKTFVLKKPNDTMSHADITRNYLHTRDMQTSAFFAISLLRERRVAFFECLTHNITDTAAIQSAFNVIGLGTVPDFFHQYMVDVGRNAADADADGRDEEAGD